MKIDNDDPSTPAQWAANATSPAARPPNTSGLPVSIARPRPPLASGAAVVDARGALVDAGEVMRETEDTVPAGGGAVVVPLEVGVLGDSVLDACVLEDVVPEGAELDVLDTADVVEVAWLELIKLEVVVLEAAVGDVVPVLDAAVVSVLDAAVEDVVLVPIGDVVLVPDEDVAPELVCVELITVGDTTGTTDVEVMAVLDSIVDVWPEAVFVPLA